MRIAATIFSVTAFLLVTALALFWTGAVQIPNRWNPFTPIAVEDPPNLLTGFKLKRLANDPAQCLSVLKSAAVKFAPQADRNLDLECAFRNVVRVNQSSVAYSSGFIATCPLAVGLAIFERHALQPAAEAAFNQPVTHVTHFGTYACRNVNNRETGRRSQHATANAIDLAAFRLKDGRSISLQRDWAAEGASADAPNASQEARFLRDLQRRACRIFPTVLGPDYNAAHHNHFHMDMGGFRICR